tara:strand:+ start:138 stop:1499 length:1362 start_codon:yes stop_codon:yes gene_type:complete
MTQTFTVLTEENPNIDEVKLMLSMIGVNIPDSIYQTTLLPNITSVSEGKQKFKGVWTLEVDDLIITIKLFKGKTSSVDYMLFKEDVDLTTGNAEEALVILESTKTSDDASRNTAVYQRITKFTTFDTMYPNFKGIKVMFWCNSIWKDKLTQTAILGMRLMETLNINMYSLNKGSLINIKEKYGIAPYECCDDIIVSKNAISQKKGNSSIRLSRVDNNIYISLKLDKGNASGIISHDPNVGFLTAIINAFENVTKKPNHNKYIIINHNIKQNYFDKCPKSKLWYSIHDINIVFEECVIKKRPELPSQYFTLESDMTEKLATILYDYISPNETIFSNHGSCALTCIKGYDDTILSVGQKMPRPDIVFRNDEYKEIEIIEGKLEKELGKGIKQLSNTHLEKFVVQLKKLYPDYTIKKGLCITINSVDCIDKYKNLEIPVKFAIDNEGFFIHLSQDQ